MPLVRGTSLLRSNNRSTIVDVRGLRWEGKQARRRIQASFIVARTQKTQRSTRSAGQLLIFPFLREACVSSHPSFFLCAKARVEHVRRSCSATSLARVSLRAHPTWLFFFLFFHEFSSCTLSSLRVAKRGVFAAAKARQSHETCRAMRKPPTDVDTNVNMRLNFRG